MREEVYESHVKKLIACTILSGEHYRIDNESVWVELKSLVIDGFAWSYIKKFEKTQDGRGAVLALKRQCEGKTSIKTRKNAAYVSIRQSNYREARKAFTFAQYVAIHQNAHNELEDCGEAMPESKKVADFIDGITDPSLAAGITCVMSEERYSDSFEATQQFLGTLVANQAVHNRGKRGDDRNVSSTKGARSGGGNKSKKGKSGKKLEARFYPREEWEALTQEERAKVLELKKKSAKASPAVVWVSARRLLQRRIVMMMRVAAKGTTQVQRPSTQEIRRHVIMVAMSLVAARTKSVRCPVPDSRPCSVGFSFAAGSSRDERLRFADQKGDYFCDLGTSLCHGFVVIGVLR
jgi:hypothetical protein